MYDTDLRLAKLLEYYGEYCRIVLYLDSKEISWKESCKIGNNSYLYNVVKIFPCDSDSINVYVTKVKEREMR